jgi:hypothetical protein
MSHVEDAIARLLQIRGHLAPISERLLDIEARLAASKATDIARPAKISLREFSTNLFGETQHYSPGGKDIEKYRGALRSSVK